MFTRVCAPCILEGFRGGQGYGLALWERGKEESWRQEQRGELSCLMLSSAGCMSKRPRDRPWGCHGMVTPCSQPLAWQDG